MQLALWIAFLCPFMKSMWLIASRSLHLLLKSHVGGLFEHTKFVFGQTNVCFVLLPVNDCVLSKAFGALFTVHSHWLDVFVLHSFCKYECEVGCYMILHIKIIFRKAVNFLVRKILNHIFLS